MHWEIAADASRAAAPGVPRAKPHAPRPILILLLLSVVFAPLAGAELGVHPGHGVLGDLVRGGSAATVVTVRNGGDDTLTITTRFEGGEGATLSASPGTFSLGPGAERQVQIEMRIGGDAAPGRHTARFIATASQEADGVQAIGAVAVQVHYGVAALDVAYADVLDNHTVFLRIVNGHDAARTVTTRIAMTGGNGTIETTTLPGRSVVAGGNLLAYTALTQEYPNGTYTLRITGNATGGPTTEAFDATYTVTKSGAGFTVADPKAATAGGGGGGGGSGGPTEQSEPSEHARPGGGGWSPDVLTYPVPERPPPPQEQRDDRSTGRDATGSIGTPDHTPLPAGLETAQEALTYSTVAAAIALVAGVAVFLGRGRIFH